MKNIRGKTVLLRADFNVPIENGRVEDDYKIIMTLPTIRFLLRYGCKIVIITHLDEGNSAEPIADRLKNYLDVKVTFVGATIGKEAEQAAREMSERELVILENLRFDPGEMKNDKKFARSLAKLADFYVNDCFAVDHREHASLCAIKKFLPSFAGLLLEKELHNLEKVMRPEKPMISIIGGAKIETKIKLIKSLLKKSSRVLIGGALANNFIAARGFEIGKSLIDPKGIWLAQRYNDKRIILPVDVIVAHHSGSHKAVHKSISKVSKDDMILDIGPNTIKLFAGFINNAHTIIWNGPMGYFENDHFKHGTMSLARLVASRSSGKAFGVVGGGETVESLKATKMADHIDWISTGGGAMLTYLGGEKMPGLKGIVK